MIQSMISDAVRLSEESPYEMPNEKEMNLSEEKYQSCR